MSAEELADPLPIEPVGHPLDAVVRVPGSKSITNRALVCAALAEGRSTLSGALAADDTEAMAQCLDELGIPLRRQGEDELVIDGAGGPPARGAVLDARLSGTTARFVAPLAALARGTSVLDGAPPLRERPMGDLLDALASMGAEIVPLGEAGRLPVQISAAAGLRGGTVSVRGDASSQFLSGLLLSAPAMAEPLVLEVSSELVSVPYVEMTLSVMREFGAEVSASDDLRRIEVHPGGYTATDLRIEPDASAASYFFAAAALCGGRVRVEGLSRSSTQGDVAFLDVLEAIGAEVRWEPDAIEVHGYGPLHGVDVDMSAISDTAQTLAALAPFAEGPTRVTGIGFIRGKETDRIAAVVTELQRLGVEAVEEPDGFSVQPGPIRRAVVQTYRDHRMAMSFALVGLRAPGVSIADPGCVAKTFPGYWDALDGLRGSVP